MKMQPSLISMVVLGGCLLTLACCASGGAPSSGPASTLQSDLAQPRRVFAPVTAAPTGPSTPPPAMMAPSDSQPRLGLAGMAQAAASDGNPTRGRDFAFDNCRPCHVVAPNQPSTTRFSNAPAFRAVANMPSTTPLSLMVWLTNPHPTMPSLVLSPQEASDVIAYIESLRDRD